jgi:hypothetical protein
VKKGHKKFGAYGTIQRTTKRYVFFFNESEKVTVQIASTSIEHIIYKLRRSLGVNTINFLKGESGGSLMNR